MDRERDIWELLSVCFANGADINSGTWISHATETPERYRGYTTTKTSLCFAVIFSTLLL
jgi:hypothetical protein